MDIYRATVDFMPPHEAKLANVISLRDGEYIDVLELENDRKFREWWGVRRIDDDKIGYVPAKYLQVGNPKFFHCP